MDEQEDLPKDMLEQVGNASHAPLWLPRAEMTLCKVIGTKAHPGVCQAPNYLPTTC